MDHQTAEGENPLRCELLGKSGLRFRHYNGWFRVEVSRSVPAFETCSYRFLVFNFLPGESGEAGEAHAKQKERGRLGIQIDPGGLQTRNQP